MMAEFFGTYWLVFGGCGSAILAAGVADVGIGWLGVSLAFGLTVLTMAFAVGHISGGHFNPAVTLGLVVGGRHPAGELLQYWAAQVLGAIAAAATLYVVFSGTADCFGDASPEKYGMMSALVIEIVLTAFFLIIILGATSSGAPAGFAPIAIGLALTLIHLISIPVTNTSVNPARSTGMALFAEGPALSQLWLFWIAPLIGGALGAVIWKVMTTDD
ncbi:UNVERIFIED_CONTAM: hypothetical protein GTU68_017579 [Idotea baltica]|nr:hypothetical protein [Idotea baltica]